MNQRIITRCFHDEDIARIPIRTAFPDYTGKAMYEESLEFIQARFKEQRKQGPVSGVHYPNLEIHGMLLLKRRNQIIKSNPHIIKSNPHRHTEPITVYIHQLSW